jgi:hypothetical protein
MEDADHKFTLMEIWDEYYISYNTKCVSDLGRCMVVWLIFPSYFRLSSVLLSFKISEKRP